ncbi:unnamed protein product, partial [Mesorhabditis belari]|uniref:Uncharacterized protein n=1 Tax=Mesorhabditis belari TaxID=2138241 RepID=A0AAF3F365_9BILA
MDSEDEFFSASSGDEEAPAKTKASKKTEPELLEAPKQKEENVFVELRKPSTDESSEEASVTLNEVEKESSSSEEFVVTDLPTPITLSDDTSDSKSSEEKSVEVELRNEETKPAEEPEEEKENESSGWDAWGDEDTKTVEESISSVQISENKIDEKKDPTEEVEEGEENWDWGNDGWETETKKESTQKKPAGSTPAGSMKLGKAKTNEPAGWGGFASALGKTFSSAVENTFGLPSAEEFAQKEREVEENETIEEGTKETPKRSAFEALAEGSTSSASPSTVPSFGLFSGLVTGGLDALEAIGKKTFETLTVKDKKGRSRLFFDQSSDEPLSDLLKRIKDEQSSQEIRSNIVPVVDFLSLIGATTTMQNVEALELLTSSKGIPTNSRTVNELLTSIAHKDVPDSSMFEANLRRVVKSLCSTIDPSATINVYEEACNKSLEAMILEAEEAYKTSVNGLVSVVEAFVQILSKVTQMIFATSGKANKTNFLEFCGLLTGALVQLETVATNLPSGTYQGDDVATRFLAFDHRSFGLRLIGDDVATRFFVDCQSAQELLERILRLSITVLLQIFQNAVGRVASTLTRRESRDLQITAISDSALKQLELKDNNGTTSLYKDKSNVFYVIYRPTKKVIIKSMPEAEGKIIANRLNLLFAGLYDDPIRQLPDNELERIAVFTLKNPSWTEIHLAAALGPDPNAELSLRKRRCCGCEHAHRGRTFTAAHCLRVQSV